MKFIDENKLIELCEKHTYTVSFNGLSMFTEKIINVNKLFEHLHTVSEYSKDEFLKQVNRGNKPPLLKEIFDNVEFQGVFKIAGFEVIGNAAFIRCSKLSFID